MQRKCAEAESRGSASAHISCEAWGSRATRRVITACSTNIVFPRIFPQGRVLGNATDANLSLHQAHAVLSNWHSSEAKRLLRNGQAASALPCAQRQKQGYGNLVLHQAIFFSLSHCWAEHSSSCSPLHRAPSEHAHTGQSHVVSITYDAQLQLQTP